MKIVLNVWDKTENYYTNAKVELLSDHEWLKMQNTDSWDIAHRS
jgi:hypothetical protein